MSARSRSVRVVSSLAAILVLFLLLVPLQERIDAQTRTVAQEKQELLLTSGPVLKKLCLGYDPLVADIYWTRAIQYYGGLVGERHSKFELLWPLLDLTTTLDPHLIVAYRVGAIFLSEPHPMGAGRPDLSVELVKRGIRENPDEWRLDTDLGFLYFWHMHDYADASQAYLQASKNPNVPEWVSLMAARMADRSDSLKISQMIWSSIYQATDNKQVRSQALEHLKGLKALEDERFLDNLFEQFRQKYGRYPGSMEELREKGYINGVPVDPDGFAYRIGRDGKTQLDAHSTVETEFVPPNEGQTPVQAPVPK